MEVFYGNASFKITVSKESQPRFLPVKDSSPIRNMPYLVQAGYQESQVFDLGLLRHRIRNYLGQNFRARPL